MGAVAGFIPGVVIVIDKVPTDQIINKAVVVIINAVFYFVGVFPQIFAIKIRMKIIQTGIYHRHNDRVFSFVKLSPD